MSHHLSGPGQAFAGAQGSFVTVSLLSAICLLSVFLGCLACGPPVSSLLALE
jgi:hypothetical protein